MIAHLELLYHYSCDFCKRWWTIADVSPIINMSMHCLHCGKQSIVESVKTAVNLTPEN